MCFAMACSLPMFGFVAADTAWSYPEGLQTYGGKVRRIPGGWTTATGSAVIGLHGFRALEKVGIIDVEAARSAIVDANEAAERLVFPEIIDQQQATITRFYTVRESEHPFSLHTIYADGHGDNCSAGGEHLPV